MLSLHVQWHGWGGLQFHLMNLGDYNSVQKSSNIKYFDTIFYNTLRISYMHTNVFWPYPHPDSSPYAHQNPAFTRSQLRVLPLLFLVLFFCNSSPLCAVHIGTPTGTWLTCQGPHPWTNLVLLSPESHQPSIAALHSTGGCRPPWPWAGSTNHTQKSLIHSNPPHLWLWQSFCTLSCGDPCLSLGLLGCDNNVQSRLWLSALWTFLLCSLTSWELLS